MVLVVKNLPANEGDKRHTGSIPESKDPLEKGMVTYCSILALRISWTEELDGLQSIGLQRVRHNWSNLARTILLFFFKKLFLFFVCFSFSSFFFSCMDLIRSDQSFSRVRLCDPMNRSMPGLPVHHQLPEFTQTHVHRVGDAIQPSHLLSSPSLPAPNSSQHQSLFQWVNSSHEVAKVLEFQL